MRKRILVASIIVILFSLILASLYMYFGKFITINNMDNYIIIKKSSSIEQVAKQLKEKGIIKSEDAFINYAKIKGLKGIIEGRNLIIEPNTKLNDLIIRLKDKKSEFTIITIPEGYTLYQIASKLEENKLVKKEDMLKEKLNVLKANTLISSKKDVYYDLEGYLFPDTYYIPNDASEDQILNIMVDRFKLVFTDKYKERTKELKLDVNQVITIASLIEREAGNDSERSRIAGVIYNRLKKDMLLQIDAAVIYANTNGEKNIDKVYYNTLKIKSKYNTYLYKGLPPGPIASPGKASIEAALYPEKNDYLYYVANGNEHLFSKTYEEHLRNVKKYIK
jgi:UPF0755 protein